MSIADRLDAIRREAPPHVAIVAVTKGRSVEECREALAAGLSDLGENRTQEALPKLDALPAARWHLVGHLQRNKARHAGRFSLVQSVDSVELAEAIATHSPGQGVLLQVNTAREPQKHGCAPEEAVELAARISGLLLLRGFMCIGPLAGDPAPAFGELRALRDEAQARLGVPLPVLSMGMTDDWEVALACGSSMLRLGRALFG
ncbi:MAG TPA: YggS family pyridoxal phosphate-dependent enzyme [Candidatus Dormibacteraeota bacterium]